MSIQLVDYNNPSSKDNAGSCCDCCGAFGWCPNDCENFFKLFVVSYPLSVSSFLRAWKHWETYILGDESFSFPGNGQTVGANDLKNPLTYHFSLYLVKDSPNSKIPPLVRSSILREVFLVTVGSA